MLTDDQLVDRTLAGDADAFGEVVGRYQRLVTAICRRLLLEDQVADEPEPFGQSLDVECIDYFRQYYLAGLETVLLTEAEKVARAAGLAALDIGTNTCSGEYVSLRRSGLKVFYEYDHVQCRCGPRTDPGPRRRARTPETADLTGLIRASHWSPTDFTFRGDDEATHLAELSWPDRRAIVELWHHQLGRDNCPVPENPPNRSELYVEPDALTSAQAMTEILAECAALAGELGAGQIQLPCPSELELDSAKIDVIDRQFAFAWLRKSLWTPGQPTSGCGPQTCRAETGTYL